MITVLKLRRDMERYTALGMVHEPDIQISFSFNGNPLGARWSQFRVSAITEEFGITTVGDFTTLGTIPVFSERAVTVLGDFLTQNGELLPLEYPEAKTAYFAFNVTRIIDALDRERTVAQWFDNDRIMVAERYAFHAERLRDAKIFKIPQSTPVFITDSFVQRLQGSGLEGFAPVEVWRG